MNDITLPEYDLIISFINGMEAYRERTKGKNGNNVVVLDGEMPGYEEAMASDFKSLEELFGE